MLFCSSKQNDLALSNHSGVLTTIALIFGGDGYNNIEFLLPGFITCEKKENIWFFFHLQIWFGREGGVPIDLMAYREKVPSLSEKKFGRKESGLFSIWLAGLACLNYPGNFTFPFSVGISIFFLGEGRYI